jgi:hypothetical protein
VLLLVGLLVGLLVVEPEGAVVVLAGLARGGGHGCRGRLRGRGQTLPGAGLADGVELRRRGDRGAVGRRGARARGRAAFRVLVRAKAAHAAAALRVLEPVLDEAHRLGAGARAEVARAQAQQVLGEAGRALGAREQPELLQEDRAVLRADAARDDAVDDAAHVIHFRLLGLELGGLGRVDDARLRHPEAVELELLGAARAHHGLVLARQVRGAGQTREGVIGPG